MDERHDDDGPRSGVTADGSRWEIHSGPPPAGLVWTPVEALMPPEVEMRLKAAEALAEAVRDYLDAAVTHPVLMEEALDAWEALQPGPPRD